jgi:Family of unknown function (DUF5715)
MGRYFKICALGISVLLFVLLVIIIIHPQFIDKGYDYFFSDIVGVKCIDYKQASFSRKLNSNISDYIGQSSLSGIKKCMNEKDIQERVTQGELVEVESGNGFIIDKMPYSYPYLTKESKILLFEISKRFSDKLSGTRLNGSKFKITSMTRTLEKVKNLKTNNVNAVPNSPHLYGNAFDISYLRFSTRKLFLTYCDKKLLKEALAEVIWQLMEEKKCWATYELKQNCYHVVAR